MIDQAHVLRTLMQQSRNSADPSLPTSPSARSAHVLALTSAKGGVGKTSLALQTAVQLSRSGKKVCVWDVDGNAAHDLLAGFHHCWSLDHILTGARSSQEILATGPEGVQFFLGSGVRNLISAVTDGSKPLEFALSSWEREFDAIILDLPTIGSADVRQLIEATHSTWLVCTPEPAAIAASYSCLKQDPSLLSHLALLVNQAASAEVAFDVIDRLRQTTRMFLQHDWQTMGYIPHDKQIQFFDQRAANSPAANELQTLVSRWLGSVVSTSSFLERLQLSTQTVRASF